MFLADDWNLLLADPLLLGHPQLWEYLVPPLDERIDSGAPMIQNYDQGLDVDVTQSQVAQSHVHLPQIDRGTSQEPPLPYNNHAMILVSVTVYLQLV